MSDADRGKTWQACDVPRDAHDTHFQAVFIGDGKVCLFGGRGRPGQPAGAGRGVVLQADVDGRTFQALPDDSLRWLYGGAFLQGAGAVFGQAGDDDPGGLWRTVSDGRVWQSLPTRRDGAVTAGAFDTFRRGIAVGPGMRLVRLVNLAQPQPNRVAKPRELALHGVATADGRTAWAVGEDGLILRADSDDETKPWLDLYAPLPMHTTRLADFCAVAVDTHRRVWLGGGRLGCLLYTDDAGAT